MAGLSGQERILHEPYTNTRAKVTHMKSKKTKSNRHFSFRKETVLP